MRARSLAATSCSISPRSTAGVRSQPRWASAAAAIAASSCSSEVAPTVATVSSVNGFSTSISAPSPATRSPPISSLVSIAATGSMLLQRVRTAPMTEQGREITSEQASRREETEEERLDRNLDELLQELRVALPGIQVLFAFLLVVPFQQGWAEVTDFEQTVYYVTLLLTASASVCLIAPTARHRMRFRELDKEWVVQLVEPARDRRAGVAWAPRSAGCCC